MNSRRIVLVYPGQPATVIHRHIHIHLPLALLQLGAWLRPRGFEVVIYDMRVQRFEEIDFAGSLAVGFSTMTNPQIRHALDTAARLRRDGHTMPFVWGGVHPSLFPEQCLADPLVDFVARREGEETLTELLSALARGEADFSAIRGLSYRDADGAVRSNPDRPFLDLDTVPLPAYDLVEIERYPKIRTMFDYQTSRGCPFRCEFCYNIEANGRRWRARSAENVVEHLETLIQRYGVQKFAFVDDELFIDRKRIEAICDLVLARGLKFEWNCSCRLDIMGRFPSSLMKKLKQAGCNRLYFGAESGSDRVLAAIHKDLTVAQIERGARHAVAHGIVPIVSLMSGFRQESEADTLDTLRLVRRLWAIHPSVEVNGVFFYNAYPGSPLYQDALRHGVTAPDSFAGWARHGFDYDGCMPWVTPAHARMIRALFAMTRSRYYVQEIWGRKGYRCWQRSLFSLVNLPLALSRHLRMRYEYFDHPIEWRIWAWIMKRSFGFL